MNILIIQTAFIGDVVLATALLEQLHRCHPDAQIDFLVRRGNEGLLSGHPFLRRVLVWDKKKSKYVHLLRLARQIRHARYDWVINCQRFAASGLLTVLSGAKTSGFDKNPFSLFFTRRVSHRFGTAAQPVHEIERNIGLIAHLTDGRFERPRLYPAAADYARADTLSEGKAYMCMAPVSVWFTKQLPEHKWVTLIQQQPANYLIFLLGGPGDHPVCERIAIAAAHPGVRIMTGQLSFLASAALMSGARMNYVNDSAPLHFASAMNAPVTAFFCSTLPAFGFTPVSDEAKVVETHHVLSCRPCGLHGRPACPQGHFRCGDIKISNL
jgi:heptosyltransferase-2